MILTPQMAISHIVMTIGVGISQKKNIKNFDNVQILWNDQYKDSGDNFIFEGFLSLTLVDSKLVLYLLDPRQEFIQF